MLQSDASNLPNPWIAPATLPRRSELQIIALSQVTTVVSRSFSRTSMREVSTVYFYILSRVVLLGSGFVRASR